MKKIALLSVLALGFGFTACDNYEEPNPPAQSNPQESVLQLDDVTVVSDIEEGAVYNLEQLSEADAPILLATIECATLPAGYVFEPIVEISNNNFSSAVAVNNAFIQNGEAADTYQVFVTADDLQGAYVNGVSKSPAVKEIQTRIGLKAVTDTEVAYVGNPNSSEFYYGPFALTVQPFPSDLVIEDAYYLLGTINGWDVATAVKFNHPEGVSGFDDPVFSLAVNVTNDEADSGWWWKVIPASTYELGTWPDPATDYSQFGVAENGDSATEGMLVAYLNGEEPGAGCLKTAGMQLLTINLEEGTYSFTSAVPCLYTPGDANGWSQTSSQQLYTDNYADYYGYAVLGTGGFKFSTQPDWNGVNYGDSGVEGTMSTDGGAGNLSVPATGLYWCHVNTSSLTYEVTLIETYGVIGDATPGGWDASTALYQEDDYVTFTGEVTFGAGEFKFRANNGWDFNLGGDLQDLVQDGANIPAEAGTYTVTLNLGQLPYSATLVKK